MRWTKSRLFKVFRQQYITAHWILADDIFKRFYSREKSIFTYTTFFKQIAVSPVNRGVNHFWNLVSLHWNLTGISSESHGISESLKNLLESSESHWNPWNLTGIPGILSESLESYRNPKNLTRTPGILLESLESQ